MEWKLPANWVLPPNEVFYKTLPLFEHTKTEYDIVLPHIKEFRTVIDIGAHIGTTTVRYAKDFQVVHAFEPLYFRELVENTSHLTNVVRHKFAVSDKSRAMEMMRHKSNSGMTMVIAAETKDYLQYRANWFEPKVYNVESITIDECQILDVDFIKIDTENYVLPILKGAEKLLNDYSPVLQIELTQNIEVVEAYLTKFGYQHFHSFSVDRFYKK